MIFPTTEKWCFIKRKTHAGNNPYILVTEKGSKFKCFDEECKDKEGKPVAMENLPVPLKDLFNKIFYGDQISETAMSKAKSECADVIKTNYPLEDPQPRHDLTRFVTPSISQKCNWCNNTKDIIFEHSLDGWGVRCQSCQKIWPTSLIKHDQALTPNLIAALTQFNVNITVNNMNVTNNYGVGEIDFYADFSNDNLNLYGDPEENTLFIGSLQGTDTTLSRFTTYHFRDQFHCTLEKNWYRYDRHCWVKDSAELIYKEAMNKPEFLQPYQRVALYYENQAIQTDEVKRKARMIRKLCLSLEDGKQRDKIVTDSIIKFHERRPKFSEELNTQNVMVFQDGVFDFDTFTFGPGTPERAITMRVPQNYTVYDENNSDVQFLMSFMCDILPDPNLREYMLKVMGIALTLDTSQQFFWVLTGAGGNGKGKLMTLLEECLGDYYQAVSPALLTRRREDANQSNEALMALRKARLAVAQEAEEKDVIQAGIVKAITGQDTLTARENYGKQVKFRPTFKTFFVCNEIPCLSESTLAIWRRVKVIHFITLFMENPDPNNPNHRLIDYNIDVKLKSAAPYFLAILIHYYRKFRSEGLQQPLVVTERTKLYQSTLDVCKEFLDECLEKASPPEEHQIEYNRVVDRFKEWAGPKHIDVGKDELRKLKGQAKLGQPKNTSLHRDKWPAVLGYPAPADKSKSCPDVYGWKGWKWRF